MNIKKNSLMYTWSCSINGMEEETDDNAVSYRTNTIRIALDKEEQAMTKVMAVQTNATVLSRTIEPMYSHRSRHRE